VPGYAGERLAGDPREGIRSRGRHADTRCQIKFEVGTESLSDLAGRLGGGFRDRRLGESCDSSMAGRDASRAPLEARIANRG
jgi:hypothetical protein